MTDDENVKSDKEKLVEFATKMSKIYAPECSSDKAKEIATTINYHITQLAFWTNNEAESIQ